MATYELNKNGELCFRERGKLFPVYFANLGNDNGVPPKFSSSSHAAKWMAENDVCGTVR